MKIKSESADDALREASAGTDYGPRILEVLATIPKGDVVADADMQAAIGASRDRWYGYTKRYPDGPQNTHRCYVGGKPKWAHPETVKYLLSKGAKRSARGGL